jgi:dolichyl-phosphate beta-glucosyltransferase
VEDQTTEKSATTTPHLSIVVPAFNEESRIGASITRMVEYFDSQPYSYEILVVDDGSTDSTLQVVAEKAAGHNNVHSLHYNGNKGKGFAVRYGMIRATGDFVLFSDADLATPIEEVEKLEAAVKTGADIAIGSRDVPGSKLIKHQSPFREMAGKMFNKCVQRVGVPGIHDTQCGFKLFTRAAAQNLFRRCQIDGFSFDVEVLYLGRQLGYTIAEVPIVWEHKEGSKVRPLQDGLKMLRTLFVIKATDYHLKSAEAERNSSPYTLPPTP